jgi:small subunit ribosomal protein S7
MSRAKQAKKRQLLPDPIYQNRLVAKLINVCMYDGKKSVSQKHVYSCLEALKVKTKAEALGVLRTALDNIKPVMEVRSRRVGGAAYQVPSPVRGERREALAIRWLVAAARARSNTQYHHFHEKLAAEILDAANNQGGAVEKKNQMHKVAEANKAFAHFRW